jgi:hypothetical protein
MEGVLCSHSLLSLLLYSIEVLFPPTISLFYHNTTWWRHAGAEAGGVSTLGRRGRRRAGGGDDHGILFHRELGGRGDEVHARARRPRAHARCPPCSPRAAPACSPGASPACLRARQRARASPARLSTPARSQHARQRPIYSPGTAPAPQSRLRPTRWRYRRSGTQVLLGLPNELLARVAEKWVGFELQGW